RRGARRRPALWRGEGARVRVVALLRGSVAVRQFSDRANPGGADRVAAGADDGDGARRSSAQPWQRVRDWSVDAGGGVRGAVGGGADARGNLAGNDGVRLSDGVGDG